MTIGESQLGFAFRFDSKTWRVDADIEWKRLRGSGGGDDPGVWGERIVVG
jgi:hypothetical protein